MTQEQLPNNIGIMPDGRTINFVWSFDSTHDVAHRTKVIKMATEWQGEEDEAYQFGFPDIDTIRHMQVKKELDAMKKQYSVRADSLMKQKRLRTSKRKSSILIDGILSQYTEALHLISSRMKFKTDFKNNEANLARAKAVPVSQYIKFGTDGMAPCIWHSERTPSMHYYPKQNRVKCFSCGKLGDVLDVVQQMNSLTLPQAINFIIGK